jgi:hypothetical protein
VAIAGAFATVLIMPRRIKTAAPAAGTGSTPVSQDAAGSAESAESGLASKLSE